MGWSLSAKSIAIPEGNVKKIVSNGVTIWEKAAPPVPPEPPVLLSWEHVLWSIANNSYTTDYSVGDLIPLDLGTGGNINMQIVAFDADDRADGTGKSHISFVSKELLAKNHRMNPELSPSSAPYDEGTGTIGGWEKSDMRSYLKSTIKPLIRSDVRSAIVDVTKYTNICNTSGYKINNSASTDDVWIPSYREIFGGTLEETNGADYNDAFSTSSSRKKKKVNSTSVTIWRLRSAYSATDFSGVATTGSPSNASASTSYAFALGFCL